MEQRRLGGGNGGSQRRQKPDDSSYEDDDSARAAARSSKAHKRPRVSGAPGDAGDGGDADVDVDDVSRLVISSGRSKDGCHRCGWPNCGYTSHLKASVVVHLRTHTREKRFFCRHGCGYGAGRRWQVTIHERTVRLPPAATTIIQTEFRIPCERCSPFSGGVSPNLSRGRSQVRVTMWSLLFVQHTGETPYACPLCPLQFKVSSGLAAHHRRMHMTTPSASAPRDSAVPWDDGDAVQPALQAHHTTL